MMKIKGFSILIYLVLFSLVFFAAQAEAGSEKRRGTAGAMELLIPVGSRGTALGGSFNASITGCEAIFWNPAGLAVSTAKAEVMASHFEYIAGINVEYAAAASKFDIGTIAISVKSLDFGDIPITTEASPEGTGQTFSPTFITVGLTYSKQMTDRIAFGTTAKIVSESIQNVSASGIAFDFGIQYIAGGTGLRLGIALKNIGPNMKFGGADLETRVPPAGTEPGTRNSNLRTPLAAFELPSTLELGLSYDMPMGENNAVTIGGNFTNHNFGFDTYGLSAEYGYNKWVFLRGGFVTGFNPGNSEFVSSDEEFLFGPSFGAGVNLNVGSFNVLFDYAYRSTKFFDDNQWFTLALQF